MITDVKEVFSDNQAITATADSDTLDFGVADPNTGEGTPIRVFVNVTEDFNNLTSLKIDLQDSADNNTFATVGLTKTVLLAGLKAGQRVFEMFLPPKHRRYGKFVYTVTGTNPSTGKVYAAKAAG